MEAERNVQELQPLISIIIPFYNVEDYLEEAVESVRRQSYRNWQLILVDDGSVDQSAVIACALTRRDPERIVCVSHPLNINQGASAARNLGLKKADGEYMAFLDADDLWVPDKLEHQVNLLNRFPDTEMICGASLYWSSWQEGGAPDRVIQVGCRQNFLFDPPRLLDVLYPLRRGHAPSMNGLLIRRSTVERVGGFVDEFEGMYDDQAFLSKIYLSGRVYVSDKVYDKYRQGRSGSICQISGGAGDYLEHRLRYLEWFSSYIHALDSDFSDLDKLLLTEIRKCRHPEYYRRIQRLKRKRKQFKSGIKAALKWAMGTE